MVTIRLPQSLTRAQYTAVRKEVEAGHPYGSLRFERQKSGFIATASSPSNSSRAWAATATANRVLSETVGRR